MVLSFIYENTVLVGLIVVLVLFFLNKKFGYEFMTTNPGDQSEKDKTKSNVENQLEKSESEFNAFCDDVNCVRCRKYMIIIDEAFMKLMFIEEKAIAEKVERGLKPYSCPREQKNEKQQPNVFFYQELSSKPLWSSNTYPDCTLLEQAFNDIKSEFLTLARRQNSGTWKQNRTPTGSWDVFHLLNQGEMVPSNAELCPKTIEVIQSLQSVMFSNVFGNVMFSVVKPGTFITEHYGPTNVRLRCHLGINITEDCILTVDNATLSWTEGRCLLFDDSFLHSVTHLGERPKTLSTAEEKVSNSLDDDSKDTTRAPLNNRLEDSDQGSFLSTQLKSVNADQNVKSVEEQSGLENKKKSAAVNVIDEFNPVTDRVVFIVDLWHPDLTPKERGAIDLVFAP